MLTVEQCQKKLFNLGIKLGVSPRLISTRLLSTDDKEAIMHELITDDELESHVKAWMNNNMPDYANGSTVRYTPPKEIPMQRYRGIGKR